MFALLVLAVALVPAPAGNAAPARPPALVAFGAAWAAIDSYSATLTMHETAGDSVQDRTYAYTFRKPCSATVSITSGPGRGGKVVWSGGDRVVGSPPGLFSALKLNLAVDDARVTSLRGDTVVMASFGWLLDHFTRTPGTETQAPGPEVDGRRTTAVSLALADPGANAGITSDVVLLSDATKLPVDVRRYAGTRLVKEIRYTDVVIDGAPANRDPAAAASPQPPSRDR